MDKEDVISLTLAVVLFFIAVIAFSVLYFVGDAIYYRISINRCMDAGSTRQVCDARINTKLIADELDKE